MRFSNFWSPPQNSYNTYDIYDADVAAQRGGDEIDNVVLSAMTYLSGGVTEEDVPHIHDIRDALARALAELEAGDDRLAWILSLMARVYATWPEGTDKQDKLGLAIQFAEAAAEAKPQHGDGHEFAVRTAVLTRWIRYVDSRDGRDIRAAADYMRRLVPVSPNETGTARLLAHVHHSLFDHTSDVRELGASMAIARSVLGAGRTKALGFEEFTFVALVLAETDMRRHELGLLEEAIGLTETALIFAHTSDERCIGLTILADCQRALYWRHGDPDRLEQAIQAASAAASLHPQVAFHREFAIRALALGLRARFKACGNRDDLDQAIRLLRSHKPDKSTSHELSVALGLRYEAIGSYPDLIEAVHLTEQQAERDDADASTLHHYSALLQYAFASTRDVAKLTKAIEVARRAVDKIRPGEGDAGLVYNTLTTCLVTAHFEGWEGALDEAIDTIDAAMEIAPPDAPDTTTILINRARAYRLRGEVRGSPEDLEVALAATTEVLQRTGVHHPHRADRLRTFALIVETLGRLRGDPSAQADAVAARKEASRSTASPPGSRIRAAVGAGKALADDGRWPEANDQFAFAVSLLPEVAWHGLDRASQEYHLTEGADLPALAAAYALQADDILGAIDRLEVGRSVLWQHALRLNAPSTTVDGETADLIAELRRAVEVEALFIEWMESEQTADQLPREQVEQLAADLEHLQEPGAAAVVLGALGLRLRHMGDTQASIAVYLSAIAIAESRLQTVEDRMDLGMLHGNLGFAYRRAGDLERGIHHYRRSAEIFDGVASPATIANARNNLGLALIVADRPKEAAVELAVAAANFTSVDPHRHAQALIDLAAMLTQLDRLDEALSVTRRARDVFVQLRDQQGQACSWYREAIIHNQADRIELTIKALQTGQRLFGPDDPEQAEIASALATLRAQWGDSVSQTRNQDVRRTN
ncbi:tetratricopeptide repeat protein [Microbispora amethystogenes]|uniref:Tetratricopeptide repeat protein n=1 Tax=Microbispora amethystogenes TaxID=1427754 RepID=A0ABQ4FEI4_9ACTN|nr:tetratricopeptide repeat protein [Microbispora amethystogenes]GIH33242.1 hypothetical protein Mam01_34060 [Microbispora amethystogenes]